MPPYKISGPMVVSFSGGRTSAYMLRQVLDNNGDLSDLVVTFANTGKEHPATLEFVQECTERWSVPIVWLEFRDNEAGFEVVDTASASRQGEPFEALIRKRKYLPNPVTRFCTIDLKIRIIHKYLRSLGLSTEDNPVDMMTGIRADEPRRVAKIRNRKSTSESKWATIVMPLADAGIGVQDVTDFWNAQPFGLMLPTINGRTLEGNCDLCFLKGANQVYSIIVSDRGEPQFARLTGGRAWSAPLFPVAASPAMAQCLDSTDQATNRCSTIQTRNSICSPIRTRP